MGKNARKWRLVSSPVHRPRQSRYESFLTSSREPDIPTSATHVAQWALPSVRPQESSHVTKRRRSSPSYWTQSLMGALPLLRQRGGNPPRSKCWVLCLRNSSRVSFVVADGLPSSPRAGVVGAGRRIPQSELKATSIRLRHHGAGEWRATNWRSDPTELTGVVSLTGERL